MCLVGRSGFGACWQCGEQPFSSVNALCSEQHFGGRTVMGTVAPKLTAPAVGWTRARSDGREIDQHAHVLLCLKCLSRAKLSKRPSFQATHPDRTGRAIRSVLLGVLPRCSVSRPDVRFAAGRPRLAPERYRWPKLLADFLFIIIPRAVTISFGVLARPPSPINTSTGRRISRSVY